MVWLCAYLIAEPSDGDNMERRDTDREQEEEEEWEDELCQGRSPRMCYSN